jgi:cation:H+ antiporter
VVYNFGTLRFVAPPVSTGLGESDHEPANPESTRYTMTLLIWIAVFIISLYALIKASDFFTDSAEKIGLYLGLPPFIVGVTIVALGTSLPELVTSVVAVSKHSSEIVIGNVVGSNIANVFLVFGLTAIISKKMVITHDIIKVDLPFLVGSAFLLAATSWDGTFSRPDGVLCLAVIVVYVFYTVSTEEKHKDAVLEKVVKDKVDTEEPIWKAWVILVVSAVFIYLGANFTIESIIKLSELLKLGKEIIAVSAVAFGTSLPELVVTLSASRKNKPEIAVGNILGSNIFNALFVMGIPVLLGPLIIPHSIITFGLPIMLVATLLYVFITQDKEIASWEGWMLLIFYVFFIGKLFAFI